ncbi:MAG: hypothetical protein E6R03_07205 [Hyphomicrobiaceae bacterium]|nr:MAG: hypothetical protein E6R03_07205 [Hyphomicrobiaceae bacterium]
MNFQKLNVITGRNAEGKTRILRGSKIGLIGYDPSLGKTKTAKLATGNLGVSIALECDGKTIINDWNWKRTKTGLSAVGQQPQPIEIASTLLDFKTFLNKTGPQQIAFVIEQTDLNAIGFSVNALKAKIKGATPEKPTEQTEIAAQAINADIQQADAEAEKAGTNAAAWLELLFTKLKERAKLAKQELDRLTGSIQTGVTIAGETNVRNKALIDRDIEETNKEIAKVESEAAVLRSQQQSYAEGFARRETITKRLNQIGVGEDLTEQRNRAEALAKKLAGYVSTVAEKAQAVISLNRELSKATSLVREMDASVNRYHTDLQNLEQSAACPCCGKAGLACAASSRRRDEILPKLQAAESDLLAAQAAEQSADNAYAAACEEQEAARKADVAASVDQAELNAINQKLNQVSNQATEAAKLRGELEGLQTIKEPEDVTGDAAKAYAAVIQNLKAKLGTLNQELAQATAAAAARLRRIQEEEKQEQARANNEVAKLALDKVAEEKEKLVAESMKNLLKIARRFTDGIVDGLLSWENDELGIRRGENWISHEVFSGTEAAISYIGVAVALCQSSKFKLVMMDELGVVDDANLITLLGKMETLIQAGVVDQFIACDVRHERYASFDSEKVNIIKI